MRTLPRYACLGLLAAGGLACISGRPDDGLRNRIGTGAGGAAGGGGTGGTSGALTCAGTAPTFAAITDLPVIAGLPDPFVAMDGTRITAKAQWACRRNEVGAQAQRYELGTKPDKPAMVTGSFANGTLTVTASDGQKSLSFDAAITPPTTGTPPYPAMIGIGGIALGSGASTLNGMGIATITFPNDMLAAQMDGTSRGTGKFYDFYGSTHSAGAMMAWAWGVSRLIDALEMTPGAQIDTKHLGVTGCSRNGKGALIAGAFDERIALTIPQESGSGGSASWRISDAQKAAGAMIQTLGEITGENVWFTPGFSQFNSAATKLPFDHHTIEGLVAPRALFVIENDINWLGPVSTYNDSMAAHEIWAALGVPDSMGVSLSAAHAHCSFPSSQMADLQAFLQKFLLAATSNTSVLKNDISLTFDQTTWATWAAPTLQ